MAVWFRTSPQLRLRDLDKRDWSDHLDGSEGGRIALLLYVGLVLLVSHVTFSWIEEPFRLKTKAWVVNRRARCVESTPNEGRWLTVPSALLSSSSHDGLQDSYDEQRDVSGGGVTR